MAVVNFALKEYQSAALEKFKDYLQDCQEDGANVAYYKATNNPYVTTPMIAEGTPYTCMRIPTGGGKTIVAAHAVGIAAKEYLQTPNPMVLWLVPSAAILEQTLNALKNLEHPYRAALAKDFGRNIVVMTKAEALAMSRADAEGGACIIVATIQSFRREKENGQVEEEGLKVYQDAGALMGHFSGLTEAQEARLDRVEGTDRPVASLANLLKLHRPMVMIDEAHNARTPLSFSTLARFDPSLILELTATPQTKNIPAKDLYPSNVLYSVSAAELKAEQMIKMPVKLTTDRDWQKVIGMALDCQASLEEAAKAEQAQTGEYIRPIILFQAQASNKKDPNRITYDKVAEFLQNDKRIPEDQIAVHTGNRKDLGLIDDIEDPDCRVRYIITVQKLREGWDCPFAYIMCSVAEQTSATAVEQILGRVLRMPKAKLKNRTALNEAYAYVASASFNDTAQQLKDGLVDGAGFNRAEVDSLVAEQPDLGFDKIANETEYVSEPITDEENLFAEVTGALKKLPAMVQMRIAVNTENRTFSYKGSMTKEARNHMLLSVAKFPSAAKIIEKVYTSSNNFPVSLALADRKDPFIVPMLGFRHQGALELFSKEHFLNAPWPLEEHDPSGIVDKFRIIDRSEAGEIDISEQGRVEVNFSRRLQYELFATVQEQAWNLPRLANWLDRGIEHKDITKPSAIVFISRAIEALERSGISLDVLARHKYDLRNTLRAMIDALRVELQTGKYDALFATNAEQLETSLELSIIFDEQTYAYNQPYMGATRFNKHYTTIIGDMRASGEEFDCAVYIDSMDAVRYWMRNIAQKPNSFWLQLPNHRFFPDFVVQLHDGRILVVEYKGGHLFDSDSEKRKRQIGNAWAEASDGKCLFCMPTGKDFEIIRKTISAVRV